MAVSIGVPSMAETVKESKVESSSIGIGNKDYRNKQSAYSIVGSWKSNAEDNEHRYTNPVDIYADFEADGTVNSVFRWKSGDVFGNTTYKYGHTKNENLGAVIQENSEGRTFLSAVQWVSNNEFILILVKDSNEPHRNGLKRRYVRIEEPVATQLQEKAQQAAARTQQQQKLRDAQIQYDGVSGSWPQFWDAVK